MKPASDEVRAKNHQFQHRWSPRWPQPEAPRVLLSTRAGSGAGWRRCAMHSRDALLGDVSATCEFAGVEQLRVAAGSSSGASHHVAQASWRWPPVCVTLLVSLAVQLRFSMCPAIVACYFYRAVQLWRVSSYCGTPSYWKFDPLEENTILEISLEIRPFSGENPDPPHRLTPREPSEPRKMSLRASEISSEICDFRCTTVQILGKSALCAPPRRHQTRLTLGLNPRQREK